MTDPSYADQGSRTSPDAVDESTRVMPPPSYAQVPAPTSRRGTRQWSAAVLTGALVLGGAAGFGGAAAYDAVGQHSTVVPDSASGRITPAQDAMAQSPTAVENVAASVLPSVVQINVTGQSESGSGSGIVLSSDGLILTNNHVVAVAGKTGSISVALANGKIAKATIVGTDPVTDVAVIRAQGVSGLTPASIGDSDALRVGQSVVAIGSPFGLSATVTSGIVSALNRPVSVSTDQGNGGGGVDPFGLSPFNFGQPQQQSPSGGSSTTYPAIQTDAAINPGNSGGPLVDLAGRVVGINSSIRTSDSSSTSQGGSIGLGFAIPINEVLPIVKQLESRQTPTHARMGVGVADTGAATNGAVVKTVESGGAASAAGLRVGDVITKVDQQLITGADSLVATIRGHRPGQKVTLTIVRGGRTLTVPVTLGSDANTQSS